jgi:hypothetical protein
VSLKECNVARHTHFAASGAVCLGIAGQLPPAGAAPISNRSKRPDSKEPAASSPSVSVRATHLFHKLSWVIQWKDGRASAGGNSSTAPQSGGDRRHRCCKATQALRTTAQICNAPPERRETSGRLRHVTIFIRAAPARLSDARLFAIHACHTASSSAFESGGSHTVRDSCNSTEVDMPSPRSFHSDFPFLSQGGQGLAGNGFSPCSAPRSPLSGCDRRADLRANHLTGDHDLHSSILLPSFRGAIGSHRLSFPEALCRD